MFKDLKQKISDKFQLKTIKFTLLIIVILVFIYYWYQLEYVEVKVYFGSEDAKFLVPEIKKVPLADKHYQLVKKIMEGPRQKGLVKTIPEGTSLLGVKVEDGVAFVNFSSELRERHWGGSAGEIITIYSLVNSLAQFSDVKKVQILLEGQKISSLTGHLELDKPLAPDYSLVRKTTEKQR